MEAHSEQLRLPISTEADETPSIAKLAEALAKAQGMMKPATKDSKNPHFNSKYADLASVMEACREPLSKNGLAVLQRVSTVPEGVKLTTMLVHSSGEWVRDRAVFPVQQRTAQGLGSAITYARRYALAALVGVAAEDDDGNAASGRDAAEQPRQEQKAKPAKKAESKPEEPPKVDTAASSTPEEAKAKLLQVRRRRIWETAQNYGKNEKEDFLAWTKSVLGVEVSTKEWTEQQIESLENALHRLAAEAGEEKDVQH